MAGDLSRTSPAVYGDELILGGGDSNLPGYYSGNAVWGSSFAVDPARGLLYVDTGNNYSVPPGVCTTPEQTGCTSPAADDYVDSMLALRPRDR